MRATRRQFLFASAAGAGAVWLPGCAPGEAPPVPSPTCAAPSIGGPVPLPAPGSVGLIDEVAFQQRADAYLTVATQSLQPTSGASVATHLVRAQREPGFVWDPSAVTAALVDPDPYYDTADFDLMNYQWILRLGAGTLPAATITAIEDAIAGFRYRYDDPLPAGDVDNKWFWSENHRMIFAVDEYLGGLALPDRVFTYTGLTGAQHAARTRQPLLDWLDERARFGFFEWHSNTYMKYDYAPLLTLVEFADDPEIVSRAAAVIDLCFYDVATHTIRGAYGVTHGRAYKVSKTNSLVESSFQTAKLLFDTTAQPFNGPDIGPAFLIGSTKYRLPAAIQEAARSSEVATIRERHGVVLDPHEDFSLDPQGAYGYEYNAANLPFWWSQGALTAWQMVPATLDAAKRWQLFDSELFQKFSAVKQFADLNPGILQVVIRELAPFAAAGVLGEAHTYTWRSPDVMLSSVVDHRFGDAMEQVHAWQATLDPEALVFTTHPSNDLRPSTDWGNDNGYWTGTASMPRTAQVGRAAVHIYRPRYASPTDNLLGPLFGYEHFTHAFFPQDRFDEIVEQDGWVIGRKGAGYVALWSERPAHWRAYAPGESTGGHTLPFDLVAPGGADNVWICEVGRAADHPALSGSAAFGAFVAAVTAAAPVVVRTGPEIDVTYTSPIEGTLRLGTQGGFSLDGTARPLRDHPRHSSPWAEQCALGKGMDISAGGSRLELNVGTGGRRVS